METRTLQEVGGGTVTVSLPKAWAEARQLEAGADVHLHPREDGSIVLRSIERDGGELERATVTVEGSDPSAVERALRAAYAAGFETTTIEHAEAFTDEQRRAATRTARTLVGTVVRDEAAATITVGTALDVREISVAQSVRQLAFGAIGIHREGTEAFVAGDGAAAERLRSRDDEADRQQCVVSRHRHRALCSLAEVDRLGTGRPALADAADAARELERVADRGVALAGAASHLDGPLPSPVAGRVETLAGEARELVERAVQRAVGESPADRSPLFEALAALREELAALESAVSGGGAGPDTGADPAPEADAVAGLAGAVTDLDPGTALALGRVCGGLCATAESAAEIAAVGERRAVRRANVSDE